MPDFLFLYVGAGLLLLLAVSKYSVEGTNVLMSAFVLIGLMATASLGNILYYEIK